MMWKVEHLFLYGWDDAGWVEETDKGTVPVMFSSAAEADAAIDKFIAETVVEAAAGNLDEEYHREDYRAVPARED